MKRTNGTPAIVTSSWLLSLTICGCNDHRNAIQRQSFEIDLSKTQSDHVFVVLSRRSSWVGSTVHFDVWTAARVGDPYVTNNWGPHLSPESLRNSLVVDATNKFNTIVLNFLYGYNVEDLEYSIGMIAKAYNGLALDRPLCVVVLLRDKDVRK
jgi:hypothetical protein